MTKCEHKPRAVPVDRPLFVVALLCVGLFLVGQGFAQDALPAPISPSVSPLISGQSPVPSPMPAPNPPPAPLRMQPLNTLQNQANANQAGQALPAAGPFFTPQASASTAAVSQRAFSPSMIGDGFAPVPFKVTFGKDTPQGGQTTISVPGAGGTVGTSKIAENASPIPRDRVYFNYSDFSGVPLIEMESR